MSENQVNTLSPHTSTRKDRLLERQTDRTINSQISATNLSEFSIKFEALSDAHSQKDNTQECKFIMMVLN